MPKYPITYLGKWLLNEVKGNEITKKMHDENERKEYLQRVYEEKKEKEYAEVI